MTTISDEDVPRRERAKRRVRDLIEGSAPGTYTNRELIEHLGDLYSYNTANNIVNEVGRDLWRERGQTGEKPIRRSTIAAGERDALTPAHRRLAINLDGLLDGTDEAKARLGRLARLGSKNFVTRILTGHAELTLSNVHDIAQVLGVPLQDLLGPPRLREALPTSGIGGRQ